ncbi:MULTISPECIES: hypothetical protein [unclassified Streptomyces]|uniref:hypothetical protein n=1 Tax=unclassified Streptomyces TaxID=2593676 RepID=UPI0004C4C0E9|nr:MULTISPECIES: hypothetical protein [unclassified Streptomyces]KPC84761.1 hypothetical protein ADK82_01615 [Streptomyces sp. NRRL S-4]
MRAELDSVRLTAHLLAASGTQPRLRSHRRLPALEVTARGLALVDTAPGVTFADITAYTDAPVYADSHTAAC